MDIASLSRKHCIALVLIMFILYGSLSVVLYQIIGVGAGAAIILPMMLFIMGALITKIRMMSEQFQLQLQLHEATDRQLQKHNAELEALQRASMQLTSSLQLQSSLETILENALKLVHADDVHVFLYDGQQVTFGAAIWDGQQQSHPFREPRPGGVTYTVASTAQSFFVPNVNVHPLYQHWQWGGAIAALPLLIGNQVLGVMNIAFLTPHDFYESEIRILRLFADQAAIAIQNARMYEMVQHHITDLEKSVIERTAELSHAKERAEAVLNNSFDAIVLFHPESGIEQTNPAFLTLFGYEERNDIIQQSIGQFVHPDFQETFLSTLRTVVVTQQSARLEVVLMDRTGKRIVADVALAPIPSQDIKNVTVICSIRDISDKKRAEERQQEMTKGLRTVLTVINELMSCPDLDTMLREAVEALRNKLGVERCAIFIEEGDYLQGTYGTDSQGRTTDEHALRFPVNVSWLDEYQRLNSQDPQWIAVEEAHKEWDGNQNFSIGIGWISITRIQSADGFRAVLFNDTTISKSPLNEILQEVIVIFCTLLGKIIERRQIEENIRHALDKETELSELKSRFITTISHEFRTPLTVIQSSAQLVRLYYDRIDDEKKKDHMERIEGQVKQMTKLLNNVLTISRAEKIGLEFDPQPLDLIAFCTTIAEEISLTSAAGHQIIFSHTGECTNCLLDEKLLRTIITNLLTNAFKYSPPETHIYFDIKSQDKQITLSVRDEGIGIPEKDLKHLFQEFYRAHNTGSIPGTGLGLSIVKRAAEAHGGSVNVESKAGSGTTFTVTLKQNSIPTNNSQNDGSADEPALIPA